MSPPKLDRFFGVQVDGLNKVIIDAYNATNIGAIVRIIGRHKNQNALDKDADDHLWTVTAPHPMTYAIDGKLIRKHKGPAPDSSLWPIRGIA